MSTLPGSDEPFTLKRYKEEIEKPYSRITFYLCSSSDYFDSMMGDFDLDSDIDESSDNSCTLIPSVSNTNKSMQDQSKRDFGNSGTIPSSLSPNQNQDENGTAHSVVQLQSDSFEKELQCSVF